MKKCAGLLVLVAALTAAGCRTRQTVTESVASQSATRAEVTARRADTVTRRLALALDSPTVEIVYADAPRRRIRLQARRAVLAAAEDSCGRLEVVAQRADTASVVTSRRSDSPAHSGLAGWCVGLIAAVSAAAGWWLRRVVIR